MFSQVEEIQKQKMDRSMVSAWICCLDDVWMGDIETIKNKLMYKVNEAYIVSEDDMTFINEKLDILRKGE